MPAAVHSWQWPCTAMARLLQEFTAHSQDVTCLQLGRKSGQVLVTGGADAIVNMWAVGKPEPILSLRGHQSAIACVAFDSKEEVVVAGADAGTLKLWDLENSKVMRTLTGHRTACISVDFHPFGEYFASGSLDSTLKIWDVRNKNCIVTYKGHTRGVDHVKISPDGRWVVSGSQDGVVKLWDLRTGKLMNDFQHDGPVTSLDFHPNFFQLATGCVDRTVRVWDLESLQLLHQTPPEPSEITGVRYRPDGSHLVTTCQEWLRLRRVEPVQCIDDSVSVAWSEFGDLAFNAGQLVACTMMARLVYVWVVDLVDVAGPPGGQTMLSSGGVEGANPVMAVATAPVTLVRSEENAERAPANDTDATNASLRPRHFLRTAGEGGHYEACAKMGTRLAALQRVESFWVQKDIHGALSSLAGTHDDSIVVDVLAMLLQEVGLFLCSRQEDQQPRVMMGLEMAQLVCHSFGHAIARSLGGGDASGNCKLCLKLLQAMVHPAQDLATSGGITAIKAKLTLQALNKVLDPGPWT